jgi:hypothetical protein
MSTDRIMAAVLQLVDTKAPRPFVWAKTADEILGTLAAYCRRINDSGH